MALALAAGDAGAQLAWTERQTSLEPAGTVDHSMAYDEARERIVVFGGGSRFTYRSDTWLWDGAHWEQADPAHRPSARGEAAMVYDSVRQRVVLFGGLIGSQPLGETWEWDGTTWAERTPAVSPPPRYGTAMAFDRQRGQTVLFGGNSGAGLLRDTWVWDGATWREVLSPGAPFARYHHTMAYDEDRDVVILHGGNGGSYTLRGDTWEWDGTFWLFRSGVADGPRVSRGGMVYDTARGRVVLHGGHTSTSGGPVNPDTWEWDGQSWVQRGTTYVHWRARFGMAYDSKRRQVVRFGGIVSAYEYDDVWELAPTFPADYAPFGSGCQGSAGTPALSPRNGTLPWIGGVFGIEVTNVPANQPVWLMLGESNTQWGPAGLPFSLAGLSMPTCELSVSPDISVALVVGNGVASGLLGIPNVPAILGQSVYLQAFVTDPGANPIGLTTSDGGQLTFGAR